MLVLKEICSLHSFPWHFAPPPADSTQVRDSADRYSWNRQPAVPTRVAAGTSESLQGCGRAPLWGPVPITPEVGRRDVTCGRPVTTGECGIAAGGPPDRIRPGPARRCASGLSPRPCPYRARRRAAGLRAGVNEELKA